MSTNEAETISAEDRALFDRIAEKYARKDTRRSSSLPRKARLLAACDPLLKKGRLGTVLDIGCGPGAPAWYLAGHYDRYIGVDHSAQFVEIANQLHADDPNVEFVVASADDMQLEDGLADVVLCVGALHHMPNLDQTLKGFQRVAKPGASFVAIEPNRGNPLIGAARWLRGKVDSGYSTDQIYFTRNELVSVCEKSGLLDCNVRFHGYFSKPLGQVLLPCEPVVALVSRACVAVDNCIDRCFPRGLQFLSWDIVLTAKFPGKGETENAAASPSDSVSETPDA